MRSPGATNNTSGPANIPTTGHTKYTSHKTESNKGAPGGRDGGKGKYTGEQCLQQQGRTERPPQGCYRGVIAMQLGCYKGVTQALQHPSLKGGCTPKVQQHGNWKGNFLFVTKAIIMQLISLDLVGRSLSSSTQKALLNLNFNFSFI